MKTRFRTAAVQLSAGPDKKANLDSIRRFAESAARRGADLVVLPEICTWRGPQVEEPETAEPVPGPTSERLAAIARELKVHLVAGTLLERVAGNSKVFNTCAVFDPRGTMIGRYRKTHLFDVDIPGRVRIRESDTRLAGSESVVAETELAKIGLSVCYDLRFPGLYRRLTVAGAEVIAVPSAFTFTTGAAHWEVLLRARAIENQVYIVAPNQVGRSPGGFDNFGHSLIVDPWGTVIARASDGQGIAMAEINLDYLHRVRRELPCLEHGKFDP